MIINNLPESLLYNDYDENISGTDLFNENRNLEKYWSRVFEPYEREISKFVDAVDCCKCSGDGLLENWEDAFLHRVFGNAVKMFGNMPRHDVYEKLMLLLANRYNVNYVIASLRDMLGIRMSFIDAGCLDYNYLAGERLCSSFYPDKKHLDIIGFLEMFVPADRLVKVSCLGSGGLGHDTKLGSFCLDRGFFIL